VNMGIINAAPAGGVTAITPTRPAPTSQYPTCPTP
jgi:hypothetical protein